MSREGGNHGPMGHETRIHIPTPLRPYVDGLAVVAVGGATVGEALEALVARHPELRRHLYDDQGRLRRYVNVYRNNEDVRHMQREATPLGDGDTLTIVPSIAGGADAGLGLSPDELLRYSRHLILPEVGLEGQRRLKASSVLLVGAGGLGSPLALYLAAAGVGRIGIVDFDRVDASNLQRQVLYGTSSIGQPKLDAARARVADLNPGVRVEGHPVRLSSENALEILTPYDVVVDGTDNFPTRYLVNDACALLGKPNVYGSIFRFEGQVSVFDARVGPCYRCLYPDPHRPAWSRRVPRAGCWACCRA